MELEKRRRTPANDTMILRISIAFLRIVLRPFALGWYSRPTLASMDLVGAQHVRLLFFFGL